MAERSKSKRGRPPLDPRDARSDRIDVRISPNERVTLDAAARHDQKEVATWLRDLGMARAKRVLK